MTDFYVLVVTPRSYRGAAIGLNIGQNMPFSAVYIISQLMGDCQNLSKWFRPDLDQSKPGLNLV
jgi:hypothetical protein